MTETDSKDKAQTTRRAGRGVMSITAAKLYFIVVGYAVQLMLPRLLGSPEVFGLYSAGMVGISILNNCLIVSTIQTVSKRVSEDTERAGQTLRQALKLQLTVGLGLAITILTCAPFLAAFFHDPKLTDWYRVASVVVISYALYAALVGSLNGQQRFQHQAGLDMTYSTLRTIGILGAAALGYGALGAVSGFAGAAVCVLTVAMFVVGTGTGGERLRWGYWLSFMGPIWLYQLFLNMTLQIDGLLLKRTISTLLLESGSSMELAAETASRYVGFYRAAQTFSFVPYQLILSVTFVVFPMVSQAVSSGDLAAARTYIRAAMRFSIVVLLAIAAPISGASAGVMRIAYPEAYLAGSGALSILSLGMVCFALFVIAATILSGAGKPGLAAIIAAASVTVVVGANLAAVRSVGVGEHTLIAAACATSLGTTFALLAVGTTVYRRYGAFIPLATAARALAAAAVGFGVARVVPHHTALLALGALVAGGLAYLATLAVLGEMGAQDRAAILRVIRRGKTP